MIDFREKTYHQIKNEIFARIPESYDKREGSLLYWAIGPTSWCIEGIYLDMEKMQDIAFVDTSKAQYLDLLGRSFGIERKAATKAIRLGVFDAQVQTGTRFSTVGDEPALFTVIEPQTMEKNKYTYLIECETAGTTGNNYTGQLIAIDYVSGLTLAEIGEAISIGTDEETDEALRERMLNKIRHPSTSGNVHDYYNWAMSCHGVGAARVFPLAEGPGTVKVVIVDADKSAADASLVDSVAQHIESLRPIGATVTVVSAREKAINVSARIILAAGITLGAAQNRFQQAVTGYLQGSAFEAGYISLAKMGNLLLDVVGVEDYSELKLNGTAGNVSVADEEVAVTGAIRLEV